ncbi:MAG: ATP-binding protein [Actinobacteria bacterium]|nr:ATP-binding protein [Actinomycetota bacterium]
MIDISIFNPWWRDGKLPDALRGRKRKFLDEIWKYIDLRQILILTGLRRSGKTTIMFQLINELLITRNTNPFDILYFSFDEAVGEVMDIINYYENEILKERLLKKERVYLFFDEIQKLEGWSEKIKIIYDLYPNIKIFLSGSAAINIKRGTRESLAGRFFDFSVKPLDFNEYLEFRDVQIDKRRENIFEVEIKKILEDFFKTGGFIEAMQFNDFQLQKYFKEGLLERVIYKDLPNAFPISTPDLSYQLIRLLADRPGLYIDYKNIANDLKYDQRTIANYLSYLEYALLIKKVYNYSSNVLTSEKKMRRAYLTSTAFSLALSSNLGPSLIIEQFFQNLFQSKFFWRTPQKEEIDIILASDDKVIPIEIKIKPEVSEKEVAPIFKFLKKYELKEGYIITGKTEKTFSEYGLTVRAIPYWKYWSITNEIGGEAGI